jgi:UDP-N-acetylmuramoylalanine--D-glutamate ligase
VSYLEAKLNLIRGAKPGATIVVGCDDRELLRRVEQVARESGVRVIGALESANDYCLQVPGSHNRLNARCAAALCRCLGLGDDAVRHGVEAFRGLPHRLEFVGEYGGVGFFNDSKATSPRAAATGLRAFDHPVIALIGGQLKDVELDELVVAIAERAQTAICFGSAGDTLRTAIREAGAPHSRPATDTEGSVANAPADRSPVAPFGGSGKSPDLRVERSGTLNEAVRLAHKIARPGDTVLLSPGFPSFDEFANYEDRGRAFISLVRALFAKGD